MSFFHETMREILEDVQKFLNVTLESEHLCAASISHKETLLIKIHRLRCDYPQLHLQIIPQAMSGRSLHSPPPYTDMQGGAPALTDYVCSDSAALDEEYEVCQVQDSDSAKPRHSTVLEQDSGAASTDDKSQYDCGNALSSECGNFLKCGYLEKKGKDRLGGWINILQRRWVGVRDGCLLLYNKSGDKKPCSQLSLSGYQARNVQLAGSRDVNKRQACFELVGPAMKTYQFVACSRDEANDWVEVIQKVVGSVPADSNHWRGITRNGHAPSDGGLASSMNGEQDSGGGHRCPSLSDSGYDGRNAGTEDVYEALDELPEGGPEDDDEELYQDTDRAAHEPSPVRCVVIGGSGATYTLDLYVCLWDCRSSVADELEFRRGDIIRVLSKEFDEHQWWVGELNGTVGLVPKPYLMEAYERHITAAA